MVYVLRTESFDEKSSRGLQISSEIDIVFFVVDDLYAVLF